MEDYRRIAKIVGVLFIVATAAGILNAMLIESMLSEPVDLINISGNVNQVLMGALLGLIMAAELLTMFGLIRSFSTAAVIVYLPIAVQEMVFAGWLILKEFSTPTSISSSPN